MLEVIAGAALLTSTCYLIWYWRTPSHSNKAEPYGDFHLSLNQSHAKEKHCTEWLNMGYWKDTTDFPTACENLAIKMTQAANCKLGGQVLDVGHATGDSLLLHLNHPDVPRPSQLYGITSLEPQYVRAVQRVTDVPQSSATEVKLYLGDAVYHQVPKARPNTISKVQTFCHPLEPFTVNQTTPTHPAYTSIIALDCAYHFKTREQFLMQSFRCLEPGGTIALADMCIHSLPASPGVRILQRIYCVLFSIHLENLVTELEYERIMLQAGYQDVSIEDITLSVFPGFTTFLKSRGYGWWVFASMIQIWWKVCGARFIIAKGTKARDKS